MQYYLSNNGQQMGPFDEAQLVANGLNANSQVWWEGQPSWVPASQVPALAPYLQQPQYQQPQYQQPYGGYQQPASYGYNQGEMPPCPNNNMVMAIIATVVSLFGCCIAFIMGIVAIVQASGVNSAYSAGDYNLAVKKAKSAKTWSLISLILAVISIILTIILYATGYVNF